MVNAGKEFFRKRYSRLGGKLIPITLVPSLRVNTLKTTDKKITTRLTELGVTLEKAPFLKHGYAYDTPFSLGATTEYLLGYYYLQELAAQLPVHVLNPRETDLVLDACAAPGGKTTQLASHMNNNGRIIAYELKPHRIPSLVMHLERCGVTNTTVFRGNMTHAQKFGPYDKILLDAPCSGNYVTDSNWFEKRTLDGIKTSSTIQKKLLRSAVEMLKPGGVLVYSTCSLEPEENELNIHWALEQLPVTLEPVTLSLGSPGLTTVFGKELHPDIAKCKRFWPHETQTEGFFIAKLVRT